jgi:hypothetical protein
MKRHVLVLGPLLACSMFKAKPDPYAPLELDVPSNVRGAALVSFENDTYAQICSLRMWPVGAPDPGGNWVPQGRALSEARSASPALMKLKPGRYHTVFDSCPPIGGADQYHLTADITVGNGAPFYIVIDYDRGNRSQRSESNHAWVTAPMTAVARETMRAEAEGRASGTFIPMANPNHGGGEASQGEAEPYDPSNDSSGCLHPGMGVFSGHADECCTKRGHLEDSSQSGKKLLVCD